MTPYIFKYGASHSFWSRGALTVVERKAKKMECWRMQIGRCVGD